MSKTCSTCKYSVYSNREIDGKKMYSCYEALYQKIKYDNSKGIQLNTFVPVLKESDSCVRYSKESKLV